MWLEKRALATLSEPITIQFDLPKDIRKNINDNMDFIMKYEISQLKIKNEISQLLFNYGNKKR